MKLRRLSESVRGSVCNVLRLCTAVFLSTGASLAQAPLPAMGGRLGQATFVSPNFVLNLDVQVRGPDGAPLKSAAVVTLHAASGLPISTATTKRAQALFTQLAPGQYYIEVEASGYWKTREDAIIDPAVTDNVVKVSLLPAAVGSAQAIYYHTTLLAPDVQKELEKGVAALKVNRVDQARKSLSTVLKKSPNHPAALYVMGISSEKKGNIAEARQYWEKSFLFDPTQEVAVYALGQSYLNENNYAKAGVGKAASSTIPQFVESTRSRGIGSVPAREIWRSSSSSRTGLGVGRRRSRQHFDCTSAGTHGKFVLADRDRNL